MGVFAQLIRAPPSWDHLYAGERSVPSKRVILTQSTIWIAEISMHPGSNLNTSNQLKGDSWRWTSCGLEKTTQDLVLRLKRSKALIMVRVPIVANNLYYTSKERGFFFLPISSFWMFEQVKQNVESYRVKHASQIAGSNLLFIALKGKQNDRPLTIPEKLNVILQQYQFQFLMIQKMMSC